MRVLLGLSALSGLAAVSATTTGLTVTANTGTTGVTPYANSFGAALNQVLVQQTNANGATASGSPTSLSTNSYTINVPSTISAVYISIYTNQNTAQLQYRTGSGGTGASAYVCDPCAANCNSAVGPGSLPTPIQGYPCANLNRQYTVSGLVTQPTNNYFSIGLYDNSANANAVYYSFIILKSTTTTVSGDPQIVGMQGQDFQVHGVPDEIFNMVSYPSLQINARFVYLESGACHDNFTACFAHPGTYISEEGFRIGKDKVRVTAGSFKKGLTVHVNGKKVKTNTDLKHGAVEIVNHRRVVVHTELMKVGVSNSDHFLNQDLELMDDKLIALGSKRLLLKDNQKFHAEVPLHGLQGQTWRNVEYPSGLEYEGSIMDYHVVDGNLFGTDFVFNQFQS